MIFGVHTYRVVESIDSLAKSYAKDVKNRELQTKVDAYKTLDLKDSFEGNLLLESIYKDLGLRQ